MLDSGGYGGTDWSTTEVIDMWLAICNQDTAPHWNVVAGWRKSFELTAEHLSAVKSYRKNLMDAWPPKSSRASAAYIERLDILIDHLQHTYNAATANHDALTNAALALGDARAKLGPIVDEYYKNERALLKFNTTEPAFVPGHGKAKAPDPKPPVPDGRQEVLASQARSIMYGLGGQLTTAQRQIAQPPTYVPELGREDSERDPTGATYSAPTVPAVVPFDPTSSATTGTNAGSHTPQTQTVSPAVGNSSNMPAGSRQPGLILGGVQPPTVTPSPVPPIATPGTPVPTPGLITPVPPIPGSAFGGMPGNAPTSLGGTNGLVGGPLGKPTAASTGVMRAMPPGGVIGGQPGLGLGQPGAGGRSVQRVNPAGGLLNPNSGPAAGSTGRGVGTSAQQLSGGQRTHGRREDSEDSIRWDPDNPWVTSEGVPPVVLPAEVQRVDPGPAIGLD